MDDRYEQISKELEDLEELVSEFAQRTDAAVTNLQVSLEKQKKELEEKDQRRWSWFVGITLTCILAWCVFVFEVWERQYDRFMNVSRDVASLKQSQELLLDSFVKKYELQEKLTAKEKDIQQLLDTLAKELSNKDKEILQNLEILSKEMREELNRVRKR